jgi:hypothetical protein
MNSVRRLRYSWDGEFWFFSYFSMAVLVIQKPSKLANCVMDNERFTRFLRRCSSRVLRLTGLLA